MQGLDPIERPAIFRELNEDEQDHYQKIRTCSDDVFSKLWRSLGSHRLSTAVSGLIPW
jgi:hypothetical protein